MIHQIERQFVRTSRPLYSHLVTLLEGAISRGELPSGTKVPPERELALRLRISRTTVVSAYRELESRGLLRGYVGRGTFVCAAPEPSGTPFAWRGKIAAAALRSNDSTLRDTIRHSSDARLLSLAAGEPAIDCFPTESFQQAIDDVLKRDARAVWRHGPTEGQPILREAIAERFGVPADSVLVLAGAQQGLDLLARCLVDPGRCRHHRSAGISRGDSVVPRGRREADWLGRAACRRRRARRSLAPLPSETDLHEPDLPEPDRRDLPIRTRREVLKLAERYRVPIVEDGTYRELYFNEAPPPSLRELDGQNLVIHLNSFSKVMAPGLRLGWLSAAPSIVDQIAHHQAAAGSAHAEPGPVRDGPADSRGEFRRTLQDTAQRARPSLRERCSRRCSGTCRRWRCDSRGRRAGCICGAGCSRAPVRGRCSTARWLLASRSCRGTRSTRMVMAIPRSGSASRACCRRRSTKRSSVWRRCCPKAARSPVAP